MCNFASIDLPVPEAKLGSIPGEFQEWNTFWLYLKIKLFDIFQSENSFNCIIYEVLKLVNVFKTLWNVQKRGCTDSKNANRKLKLANENLKQSKIGIAWAYWCRESSVRALDYRRSWISSHTLYISEKDRKLRPECFTTSRWYGDYQSSNGHLHMGANWWPQISDEEKETIRTIFKEDARMCLQFLAPQVGLHHTTTWSFLQQEFGFYAYKLPMHSSNQLSEQAE